MTDAQRIFACINSASCHRGASACGADSPRRQVSAVAVRAWGDLPFKRGALTVSSLRAYYPNEALRLADFGQGCNDRGLYKLSKSPNNRVDARRPRGGTSTQGPPDWGCAHVWALAQSGGHKERSRLGQGCNDPASAKVPDFFGGGIGVIVT